jgi:hypothetical protein
MTADQRRGTAAASAILIAALADRKGAAAGVSNTRVVIGVVNGTLAAPHSNLLADPSQRPSAARTCIL